METGRWKNIDRNIRICKLCGCNSIGDEFHYIMELWSVHIFVMIGKSSYSRDIVKIPTLLSLMNQLIEMV